MDVNRKLEHKMSYDLKNTYDGHFNRAVRFQNGE